MWCPACRADVAAELSLDSRHFRCARCSLDLGIAKGSLGAALPAPTLPSDAERNARELLAKWHAQNLLSPAVSARTAVESAEAVPVPHVAVAESISPSIALSPQKPLSGKRRASHRRYSADSGSPAQEAPIAVRSHSWGAAIGQMCAYFGIGLMTCGTSLVLWGYFGGPTGFAPTGWLITTIGQMFLFLGIVTLISSAMEQNSTEITTRMEVLGQRLIRIEMLQREQSLAGPHLQRVKRRRGEPSDSESARRSADAA